MHRQAFEPRGSCPAEDAADHPDVATQFTWERASRITRVQVGDHLVEGLERIGCERNPAVDGAVEDDLFEFVDRDAVARRRAQVVPELADSAHRREHGDGDAAPSSQVEPIAAPHVAEHVAIEKVLVVLINPRLGVHLDRKSLRAPKGTSSIERIVHGGQTRAVPSEPQLLA